MANSANPNVILTTYNQIKQKFNGKAIAAYRLAKSEFIESTMSREYFQKF
ncbi:hypothetical protein [Chroococcidiopsis sp.]